jgi:hypothetical protein
MQYTVLRTMFFEVYRIFLKMEIIKRKSVSLPYRISVNPVERFMVLCKLGFAVCRYERKSNFQTSLCNSLPKRILRQSVHRFRQTLEYRKVVTLLCYFLGGCAICQFNFDLCYTQCFIATKCWQCWKIQPWWFWNICLMVLRFRNFTAYVQDTEFYIGNEHLHLCSSIHVTHPVSPYFRLQVYY